MQLLSIACAHGRMHMCVPNRGHVLVHIYEIYHYHPDASDMTMFGSLR